MNVCVGGVFFGGVIVRLCMHARVVAREVSSSVALHLTSILITPFRWRSSSQPVCHSLMA